MEPKPSNEVDPPTDERADHSRSVATILLGASGAGLGAMAAELQGVSSWLDAKLVVAAGAAMGAALAALLHWVSRQRK